MFLENVLRSEYEIPRLFEVVNSSHSPFEQLSGTPMFCNKRGISCLSEALTWGGECGW